MAMRPCPKCNKNDWSYVKLDNDPHIYCTCNRCGHKLSFLIPKKICQRCQQPTDFERIHEVSPGVRGKRCLLCGYIKTIPIARAEYRTINGVTEMLWHEDGEWHEVALMTVFDKKGNEAMQIIPVT